MQKSKCNRLTIGVDISPGTKLFISMHTKPTDPISFHILTSWIFWTKVLCLLDLSPALSPFMRLRVHGQRTSHIVLSIERFVFAMKNKL